MVLAQRLTLLLVLLLPGCATLKASGWSGDARRCEHGEGRMHPNGYWAEECRDGTGVLFWLVWVH
jgi:hypothetical protein